VLALDGNGLCVSAGRPVGQCEAGEADGSAGLRILSQCCTKGGTGGAQVCQTLGKTVSEALWNIGKVSEGRRTLHSVLVCGSAPILFVAACDASSFNVWSNWVPCLLYGECSFVCGRMSHAVREDGDGFEWKC
jgi:hypothetical protein